MHPDLQFYIYVIEKKKKKTTIIVIEGELQAHTISKNLFLRDSLYCIMSI